MDTTTLPALSAADDDMYGASPVAAKLLASKAKRAERTDDYSQPCFCPDCA